MRMDSSIVNRGFIRMNKGVFSLLVSFAVMLPGALAQTQNQEQQQQQRTVDSIDVIRDYRPILADAVKIRRSPDMTNKRAYQPVMSYNIIDKKLDITTGTRRLDIQEMPYIHLSRKASNYIKVGGGNYSTLMGEVYLTNDQYQDTRFGMYARHLSQRGEWLEQDYGQQEITVFGRQVHERVVLSGNLGYKRYATRFFGRHVWVNQFGPNPPAGLAGPADAQSFNDIFIDAELSSKAHDPETDPFSYAVKLNGYLYSDAFDAKENAIAISTYLDKKVNNFHVGARVSGDFAQVNGASYKLSNHIVRANPYVQFKGEGYDLIVGATIAAELGDSSRTNIFPNVLLDFALMPSYAHLFAGVDGDVEKTSLKELTRENPWMAPDVPIMNTLNRLRIYGGIKGNAGAAFGYKVGVSYKQLENMHFFQPTPMTPYTYGLVYETADKASTVFGLDGEVHLRLSETVSLGGHIQFNEYDLKQEEEAWFLPKLQLAAHTRINISDRLYLNGELQFMGQSYTQRYPNSVWDETTYGIMPALEKVSVPAFVDLSAGLEFRVSEKFGVYFQANNLVNGTYERYLHYPRIGLNVIGGVNFSF